jgi:hypothetical protein
MDCTQLWPVDEPDGPTRDGGKMRLVEMSFRGGGGSDSDGWLRV